MIRHIKTFCLLMLIASCKTVSIEQSSHSITKQQVVMGSVGLDRNLLLEHGYSNAAIPKYGNPIKVTTMQVPFSKQTHKAFVNAKTTQVANINVKYADTLKDKPKFVKLDVADKVALIEALNAKENKAVKDYLSTDYNASVITSISMALDSQMLNDIANADAVFLVQNGLKSYGIQLFDNDKATKTIGFNEGIIFSYNSSNCCWQENDKHRINIVDIVVGKTNCPDRTYPSAKQAKRKINYFKL